MGVAAPGPAPRPAVLSGLARKFEAAAQRGVLGPEAPQRGSRKVGPLTASRGPPLRATDEVGWVFPQTNAAVCDWSRLGVFRSGERC
jgi:hypothetical protein